MAHTLSSTLWQDLKVGLRMLHSRPGFTLVAGSTLALSIGACVAIFSIVDRVLLRPLPYPASERLVSLQELALPHFPGDFVRPTTYDDWRRQSAGFEGLAAVRTRSYNLTGPGEPVRVAAARVTANTLSLLGVPPAVGRDFLAEEDVAGRGDVVILDHGFWRRHFGAAQVLHSRIVLDGQPFTVVGVMPPGFTLAAPFDVLLPAAYVGDPLLRRSVGAHAVTVFGRLRPGVTVEQARREVELISARRAKEDGGRQVWTVKLTPMLEARVGDARRTLIPLLGAVAFLLLLACANVANLLLARATARRRELAIRAALGAGRRRIVRQLLTESALLASVAGLVGLVLADLGVRALVAFAPVSLPRAEEIALDGRAIAVTCALVLFTGLGFGLAPALGSPRHDLQRALVQVRSDGSHRLRGLLLVAQVAIALVLLVGAGLLGRSFANLQDVERGFRPDGAFTFSLALTPGKHGTGSDPRIAAFAERATARLAALPGVTAAGASQALPFSVDMNIGSFEIAGRPSAGEPPTMYVFQCTPGYFAAMGIRLVRGRLFDASDDARRPRVGIINESMARRFFPGEDPIGKRIGPPGRPAGGGVIVGVVADVRDGRLARHSGEVPNQLYAPLAQNPYDVLTFVVRQSGPPSALAAAIREVDPEVAIGAVRPLSDWVADSLARQRLAAWLFAAFSLAALLLAALGVYGVMAFLVGQRTRDIGIRIALGARVGHVLGLIGRQGGSLVAAGLAAGLVGALALTRSISSLLFGVSAWDPATFAAIAALLAAVSAAACLLPARRAARIDPVVALRSD